MSKFILLFKEKIYFYCSQKNINDRLVPYKINDIVYFLTEINWNTLVFLLIFFLVDIFIRFQIMTILRDISLIILNGSYIL